MEKTTFTRDSLLVTRVIDTWYDRTYGGGYWGERYIIDFVNNYFSDRYYPDLGINSIDMLVDHIVSDLISDD
jgi:hypothetical protein